MLPYLAFSWLLLLNTRIAFALMVTPNSPCASLCADDQNNANINGSEVVCQDINYLTTAAGSKFKNCITCLQLSTASGDNQDDQRWLLYNIRYSLASCLYQFSNATDYSNTPCSTSKSCGPLQLAIEDGNFITTNETKYSYCSTNYASILSSGSTSCSTCLRSGGSETYLSNFMIVLQAGCYQQPPAGSIIGLNASIFSDLAIAGTTPGNNYNATTTTSSSKGLDRDDIIGIAVGGGVLLVIAAWILYLVWRKTLGERGLRLVSPLHERYGAPNITAPNDVPFGNAPIKTRAISLAPPPRSRNGNKPGILKKSLSDDELTDVILLTHTAYIPPSAATTATSPYSNASLFTSASSKSPNWGPLSNTTPSQTKGQLQISAPIQNSQVIYPPPAKTTHSPRNNEAKDIDPYDTHAAFGSPGLPENSRSAPAKSIPPPQENITSFVRGSMPGTQHSAITNAVVPQPVSTSKFAQTSRGRSHKTELQVSAEAKDRSSVASNTTEIEDWDDSADTNVERSESRNRSRSRSRLGGVVGRIRENSRTRDGGRIRGKSRTREREREKEQARDERTRIEKDRDRQNEWAKKIHGDDGDEQWPGTF